MTLGANAFCGAATVRRTADCRGAAFLAGVAVLVTFFFAGANGRLDNAFLATLEVFALRTGAFADVARLAFGRTDFAFTARPLTEDLAAARRAGVRVVERLNPFVMGLLMCGEASKLKDIDVASRNLENEGEFPIALLVSNAKRGVAGIFSRLVSPNRLWPTKKNTLGHVGYGRVQMARHSEPLR